MQNNMNLKQILFLKLVHLFLLQFQQCMKRGTDIIFGGNPENYSDSKEWETNNRKVLDYGGLYVIGTERHESRRIDND